MVDCRLKKNSGLASCKRKKDNSGKKIKFLKKGIKNKNEYIPVHYSRGELRNYPKGTITIYAKGYNKELPNELNPINETNIQVDYFEKDRARITPKSEYYKEVNQVA